MTTENYINSFVNFNKLIEQDPAELKLLNNLLESSVRLRNTFTLTEFKRYEIIFKFNGRELLGDEDYDTLCREYYNKITPYHPVYIVDDNGELVATLPAVFNSVDCVSNIGIEGSQAIDAFTNANNSPDEFNMKKKSYSEYLSKMVDAVQDKEAIDKKIEETRIIMDNLKTQNIIETNAEIKDFIPGEISDLDSGLSDEVEYL